jgi:hypothetical protein
LSAGTPCCSAGYCQWRSSPSKSYFLQHSEMRKNTISTNEGVHCIPNGSYSVSPPTHHSDAAELMFLSLVPVLSHTHVLTLSFHLYLDLASSLLSSEPFLVSPLIQSSC